MTEQDAKRVKLDGFRGDEWPDLIWIKIFDHFNFEERQTLKLLGSRYSDILNSARYNKKTTLVLKNCVISPLCPPWTIFESSEQTSYRKIIIGENVWMHHSCRLWDSMGTTIESIVLKDKLFSMSQFNKFISNFDGLKEISLPSTEEAYKLRFSKDLEKLHIDEVSSSLNTKLAVKRIKQKNVTTNSVSTNRFDKHLIFQTDFNIFELPVFHVSDVIDFKRGFRGPRILQKYPNMQSLELYSGDDYGFLNNCEPLTNIKKASIYVHAPPENAINFEAFIQNIRTKLPGLIAIYISIYDGREDYVQPILNVLPKSVRELKISTEYNRTFKIDLPLLEELTCQRIMPFLKQANSNKFLSLKKLRSNSSIISMNFFTLMEFCPKLQELHLRMPLTVEQFQQIEEYWPNLKILLAEFHNSKQVIIAAIKGGFKCLQILDYYYQSSNRSASVAATVEDFHMQGFDKIPSLRQLFDVSYKDYSLRKFGIMRSRKMQTTSKA